MGIRILDAWSDRLTKSTPLICLKDSVIGIDANYYLENWLSPPQKESLLSALGGFPLASEAAIIKELQDLQAVGLKLHFVFDGLDFGIKDDPFAQSIASARANAVAFDVYERDLAAEAAERFMASGQNERLQTKFDIRASDVILGSPTPAALASFLKKVLHENDIPFTVAPFGALAQLVYYETHPSHFIDAVYGPSELFFFGIDKLITKFDLSYLSQEIFDHGVTTKIRRFVAENSTFRWIDRRTLIDDLGGIPSDVFSDACLLAGSKILRPFPPLTNQAMFNKGYSIRDVINLIMSCGRNLTQVCAHYSTDPTMKEIDYLDRYKRALTIIRHHIVITKEGDIETLDKDNAPFDAHDCIGQRLPEELNMYLSRGMIQPRVLNWLTSGKIYVTAPYDGGDSTEYQNLVKTQLEPMRKQALSLLADHVHRYYQRKEITTKLWFDQEYESSFNIKDLLPSPKESLSKWNVKGDVILEQRRILETASENLLPGSLSFAVRSLAQPEFASKTITPKPKDEDNLLKTRHEITANAVWRFLQLRGFVDDEHRLTPWGKVLEATLVVSGANKAQEQAAFLAVELLRLGLLNADTMFRDYSGAPMRGSDIDKRNCMLISRTASLGKLRHKPQGYTGPLSRHLLSYYSIISSLHSTLRDLLEMSLVTMFLGGHIDRERDDWMDLSLGLPLYDEHSCALGIVTMTYLDEISIRTEPTMDNIREEMKYKSQRWVPHSDIPGSLEDAFHLWDAVYKGVKTAGKEVKNSDMWDEANEWLSHRR